MVLEEVICALQNETLLRESKLILIDFPDGGFFADVERRKGPKET